MGVTYRATDTVLHRNVALKVIDVSAAPGGAKAVRERFLREARAAAALRHPNVAGVFHFGASPEVDRCYYAMELVEGETLEARVRREGPLRLKLALEIGIQVARALMAAGAQNLIHRDLKPANIMLTPNDTGTEALEVKVIDFGLAKVTAEAANQKDITHGGFVGTPAFASPEQFDGQSADARSDIYSLGVTLWYVLTGDLPCPGKTIEDIRHCQTQIALPIGQLTARKIPKAVIALLRRTLAVDPAQRPASPRELLAALESCHTHLARSGNSNLRRWAAGILVTALLAAALVAIRTQHPKTAPAPIPAKSIAVLPFENLSHDPENAYFVDGVQDEILTNLAKIADLKVISRMSVLPYKEKAVRNLPEIAQQLGVAHLLEGSVQRSGNRVRVNAQLIATSTGSHEWAETYDRELADVFGIQSEIATAIAQQLQAKISPGEKAAMGVAPTTDLLANALYQQAKAMELTEPLGSQTLLDAVRLLDQAVARDPQFVLAYCLLGRVHTSLFYGLNRSPVQRELANVALQNASRLQPDSGEVHRSWAYYAYYGFFDYDRARAELDLARRTLPNDAEVYYLTALLDRRQSRWTEAARNFERAVELDPRNFQHLFTAGGFYHAQRRYSECRRLWGRGLRIEPRDLYARIFRASMPFNERADPRPLRAELSAILAEEPANAGKVAADLVRCALAERDSAAATRALDAIPAEGIKDYLIVYPHAWFAGLVARTFGDHDAARVSFSAARAEVEKHVLAQPDNARAWSLLGRIDAALGRREDALREGRRACELTPVSKDAAGVHFVTDLAVVYTWLGENDLALEQLAISARLPAGVYYGGLKLDPQWDPLRGDPRFEKIVASLAPKD